MDKQEKTAQQMAEGTLLGRYTLQVAEALEEAHERGVIHRDLKPANGMGTPAAEKKHVLLDTPHDVTEDREHPRAAVLEWLDMYLGRVN